MKLQLFTIYLNTIYLAFQGLEKSWKLIKSFLKMETSNENKCKWN